MEIDWTWTVRESVTLIFVGLALFVLLLLVYFREKIAEWWRSRRG